MLPIFRAAAGYARAAPRISTSLRWFLLHKKTSILRREEEVVLQIHNECRELLADHRCGVYETRPRICAIIRRSTASTKRLDVRSVLRGAEQLEEYIEAAFRRVGKKHPQPKGQGCRCSKRGRSSGVA